LIQAVFFDLYETLITEWDDNKRKATYSVEELGIDNNIFKNEWATRRDKRMDGTFPDHKSVLKDILIAQGKLVDEKTIEKIHQDRVFSKSIPFKVIDSDIIKILQKLKELNIKIGLISNCAPEEVEAWDTCLLADLFDDVVFSYKVKQRKPNNDIYFTACQNLRVRPEVSFFVGDGGSNELQGASEVGMKAYHATWFQPEWLSAKITGFPKLINPMQLIDIVKMG
jgi:HAD superfamily hydrolase (TIGR01549 family)